MIIQEILGLYNRYILPRVVDYACGGNSTSKQREKVIPLAYGNVLEVGIGSGLNLPFYNSEKVNKLTGVDPSRELWERNKTETVSLGFNFTFVQANAEKLPFNDNSFDCVVSTYTMCTIPDIDSALTEIRRVLKPEGKLIFCEHGKAPDPSVRRWQNIVNPVWKQFGGGCNLNRDIPDIIARNGFEIIELNTMYIPGWKPAVYNFWGVARPVSH